MKTTTEAIKKMSYEELDAWFRDPQNDCLRARGDHRWVLACEIWASLLTQRAADAAGCNSATEPCE